MSTKADREILNHTARLLPLQEKADIPANSQGKVAHRDDYATAEFNGGKHILPKIEGGESNMTPKGKPCCED